MLTHVNLHGRRDDLAPLVLLTVPYSSPGKQLHKSETQIPAASLSPWLLPFIISSSVYHLPWWSQAKYSQTKRTPKLVFVVQWIKSSPLRDIFFWKYSQFLHNPPPELMRAQMFSNLSLALTPISTEGQTGWMHRFQVLFICFHSLAPCVPQPGSRDFSYRLLSGWIRQQLVLRAI